MSRHRNPKQYMAELGANYRRARKECGATQALVAECVDVSRAQIANFETGRAGISIYALHQLCVAIGASVESILPNIEASNEPKQET